MTARPLAPEADLAHVLDLAKIALRTGTMIDPEDLLCDLLGLDEAELAEWLNQPMPDELQWDDPALVAAEQAEVEASRQGKGDLVDRLGHTEATKPHIRHMDDGAAYCGYATPAGIFEGCGQSWPCETIRKRQTEAPDQSLPASRARARVEPDPSCPHCMFRVGSEPQRACWLHGGVGKVAAEQLPARAQWQIAEAGTVQHLVHVGRAMCAADDAGPWRTVAGVSKCANCLELEQVLDAHG